MEFTKDSYQDKDPGALPLKKRGISQVDSHAIRVS